MSVGGTATYREKVLHQRIRQSLPGFYHQNRQRKIVLIETKGDHLKNDDSRDKLVLGQAWANLAGPQYRYYMVFDDNSTPLPGAYRLTEFLNDIMKNL